MTQSWKTTGHFLIRCDFQSLLAWCQLGGGVKDQASPQALNWLPHTHNLEYADRRASSSLRCRIERLPCYWLKSIETHVMVFNLALRAVLDSGKI